MKKQKKTNLKSLLLVLLITLVMLIASSYAWFTANQTVTVNQLDVNVQATSGLQISTDAVHWKSVITAADLADAYVAEEYSAHVNQIPTELAPVSTAGIVTTPGRLDMYYGEVNSNETLGGFVLTTTKQTDARGTSGRYIAFDLFLQVNQQTPLWLTSASTVVYSGLTSSKGLENAARVAFLVQGNGPIGTSAAIVQAYNSGTTDDLFYWEPNYDVHTSAAVSHAYSVYDVTTTVGPNASAITCYGVKDEIEGADEVLMNETHLPKNVAFFDAITPDATTKKTMTTDEPFITLAEGITKIRVYMWVEGQDVDCENNASGTDIGFNLQFTAVDPTPGP